MAVTCVSYQYDDESVCMYLYGIYICVHLHCVSKKPGMQYYSLKYALTIIVSVILGIVNIYAN